MNSPPVLNIEKLVVSFGRGINRVDAVKDVDLDVNQGQIFGLVGESGSGKSTTALAVLRLLPKNGAIRSGRIALNGKDLVGAGPSDLVALRGRSIGYVPQEPMTALNPTMKIGTHLWLIQRHAGVMQRQAHAAAADQLQRMGFTDPARILKSYPFQLSGGERQRALLAGAFLNKPSLLIADEPTTALDVTIQAEVLDLIAKAAREAGTAVLFITHNLGVVWRICDAVAVMRDGKIVENGAVRNVLNAPQHPYTKGLLAALPGLSQPRQRLDVPTREDAA